MKGKVLRQEAVLVLKYFFVFISNDRRKPQQLLIRIIGGPVDIRIRYLPKYKSNKWLFVLISLLRHVTYSMYSRSCNIRILCSISGVTVFSGAPFQIRVRILREKHPQAVQAHCRCNSNYERCMTDKVAQARKMQTVWQTGLSNSKEQSPSWYANRRAQLVKIAGFMEAENSLPCAQEALTTELHPQSAESSPYLQSL
jgi:hypothetical protein